MANASDVVQQRYAMSGTLDRVIAFLVERGIDNRRVSRLLICKYCVCRRPAESSAIQPQKGKYMAWAILVIAGLFETGWAIGLKYSEGFTKFWPTIWTIVAMISSVVLLGAAMKSLPVGTAYSVWVGIGAVGTVILGIVLFGEAANVTRLISVALILAGIIGLKLATPA